MNPVCGVILSAVLLGETDSLSVMSVAALVLVCMGIYIVNRPKKGGIEKEEPMSAIVTLKKGEGRIPSKPEECGCSTMRSTR